MDGPELLADEGEAEARRCDVRLESSVGRLRERSAFDAALHVVSSARVARADAHVAAPRVEADGPVRSARIVAHADVVRAVGGCVG